MGVCGSTSMGVCGSIEYHNPIGCGTPRPGKTMLILDRAVDPDDDLLKAVLSDVVVVKYDSTKDTAYELMKAVDRASRGARFRIIGFANHGGDVWQIAKDCRVRPEHPDYIDDVMPIIITFISILVEFGGRIDLLGCHLLEKDPHLARKLEKRYPNVNFTASDDRTGNLASGGDWLMESDGNLDVKKDYFDPIKLEHYKETMWSVMDTADLIPVVGAVARTGEAAYCLANGDTDGAQDAALNAGLNAAGDVAGFFTGGTGKIAMSGMRVAGKVALKAGAKAALKAGAKAMTKKMTMQWWKSYAKKYVKKKIKKECKKQVKKAWKRIKEGDLPDELDPFIDTLCNATGMTREEAENMSQNDFLMCFGSIADLPDSDPFMEGSENAIHE